MDPIWNCVLQVCCDAAQIDRRTRAMAKLLINAGVDEDDAHKYAPHTLKAIQPLVDILQPFVKFIAGLARGADFKE